MNGKVRILVFSKISTFKDLSSFAKNIEKFFRNYVHHGFEDSNFLFTVTPLNLFYNFLLNFEQ